MHYQLDFRADEKTEFVPSHLPLSQQSLCASMYDCLCSLNNPRCTRTAFLMLLVLLSGHSPWSKDSTLKPEARSSNAIFPLSCCVIMGKLLVNSVPVSPCVQRWYKNYPLVGRLIHPKRQAIKGAHQLSSVITTIIARTFSV